MGWTLEWRGATSLPVEATGLLPDVLEPLSATEVARLRLPLGNAAAEVGELFEVSATAAEGLRFVGDLAPVRGLGRGLGAGSIVVEGKAGPFLGAGMSGGVLDLRGDAGDLAGAEMSGGLLRISGDAGRGLGAALPGSRLGMREGTIVVVGSAGPEAGHKMRRGLIAVAGGLGAFAGRAMIAGTIVALGGAGPYPGASMKRGTIVLAGEPLRLLPSFEATGSFRFPFMAFIIRALARAGLDVPPWLSATEYRRYNGDRADGGQGEILVPVVAAEG